MGCLTTFTIYNDGLNLIDSENPDNKENIVRLADIVYAGARNTTNDPNTIYGGIGCFGNMVSCQKSRHADDHTLYVHMGNCVTEMNAYSKETKELIKRNPEFAKKLIKYMDKEIKELKKLQVLMNFQKATDNGEV
jgi:hypothetical protein